MDYQSALLVVDVQQDFCAGGALAVPNADRLLPRINHYVKHAAESAWTVYASRDWHPRNTAHFQPSGGEWPSHCIQDTDGARFHRHLRLPAATIVVTKGEQPDDNAYSAFQGKTPDGRLLLSDLRERRVRRLYVTGLATDYCVKHSVMDALRFGFHVTVLSDAIAGVDRQPGDSARAVAEMRHAGATIAHLQSAIGSPVMLVSDEVQ